MRHHFAMRHPERPRFLQRAEGSRAERLPNATTSKADSPATPISPQDDGDALLMRYCSPAKSALRVIAAARSQTPLQGLAGACDLENLLDKSDKSGSAS